MPISIYLSIHLSIYLSLYLSVCLSAYLAGYPSMCHVPTYTSMYLSGYLLTQSLAWVYVACLMVGSLSDVPYLFVPLSTLLFLSVYGFIFHTLWLPDLLSIYLSIDLFVYASLYLSVHRPFYPHINISRINLEICLSTYLSQPGWLE